MKSKGVAYLLWFFLGWAGVHRMYCGRWISGFVWLFTWGLFGIGWLVDLFLTSGMVDYANLLLAGKLGVNNQNNNQNNIVINLSPNSFNTPDASVVVEKS